MALLSYGQTLIAGAAGTAAGLGLLLWRKRKSEDAWIMGLMAIVSASWLLVPWLKNFDFMDPAMLSGFSIIYIVTLCLAPALGVKSIEEIIRRNEGGRSWYFFAAAVAASMLGAAGLILDKYGIAPQSGRAMLFATTLYGLVAGLATLVILVAEFYPYLVKNDLRQKQSFVSMTLITIFMSLASLQWFLGPETAQWLVTAGVLVFTIIAISAGIRGLLFDIELHPLEGFFVALIGASAVLLLHVHDVTEFVISFGAVMLIGVYGRTALIMVMREHQYAKKLEEVNKELKDLDEERNDFSAMVAHQLRGPIGGIRAAAAMLAEGAYGALPSQAQNSVSLVRNAAERLLGLAETYMQGIKLHQGTFTTKIAVCNVRETIGELIEDLRPLSELKKLQLEVDYGQTPEVLSLDQEVLRNTMFNLIDNAIKYTDKGTVKLQLSFAPDVLTVKVSDSGIGLTGAEIRQIFNRFSRGARQRKKPGAGLGLYIVKKLLAAAGGRIYAYSEGLNQGSVFTFEMPAKSS